MNPFLMLLVIRQYTVLLQKLSKEKSGANSMFIMKWFKKTNNNQVIELQKQLEQAREENNSLLKEISSLKELVHDIEISYTRIISK